MRKQRMVLIATLVIFYIICIVRVWNVNHSSLIEKYKAAKIVYDEGTNIDLSNATYYIDVADLTGYNMQVTSTEIMKTADFLAQYDLNVADLALLSGDNDTKYEDFELIYLVTVEFGNEKWMDKPEYSIILDNFLLVGLDYYVVPATRSINLISGFNSELGGSAAFSICSNRKFQVTIPYLIDTESENGISFKHLQKFPPKLLITVYPKESYIELPEAIMSI